MSERLLFEIGGAALAGALLSFSGAFLLYRVVRFRVLRFPGGRHQHRSPTPLFGGVAVLVAILLVALFHPTLVLTTEIDALLVGLFLFLLVGFLDDISELRWPYLLLTQCLAAALLLFGGVRLWYLNGLHGEAIGLGIFVTTLPERFCFGGTCELPLIGSALILFWVLAVVNAFNWLDGADGVALSLAFLAFGLIGILSLTPTVHQPPLAILAAVGMGSVGGLLPWNASPAKIFIGSTGSFGLGFFLAALSVLAGAKIATIALILLLPAADAGAVLVVRLIARAPLAAGDRRHLHHMLERRGWSASKIVFLHVVVALCLSAAALFLPRPWKLLFLAGSFVALFFNLLFWKVKEGRVAKEKAPGGGAYGVS